MENHNSRLLYVEDDADTRELVSFMLRNQHDNCSVVAVTSASEALEQIANSEFDLYILDAWLPDMSGYDLCEHIRLKDPDTPVLFFTALSRLDDRDRATLAGADAFLCKPDNLDVFSETVGKFLGVRKFN